MKRLVVCCDGTWNDPETRFITNVVKTARAVLPRTAAGVEQVVFYDWGVGTGGRFDKISGGALGRGLNRNVQDAYRFLVHNYRRGDEVWLFGFSRGAYTARSTAGLIRNSGILEKRHADRIADAFELYRGPDEPRSARCRRFRRELARETRIRFVGVWDTVGALGVPLRMFRRFSNKRHGFHDTRLSRSVDFAYHAVAVDEKRRPFEPTLWSTRPSERQHVEQVWFAGVHSDVGGGYEDQGLANIPLRWMLDRAEEAGLRLDARYLAGHRGVFDARLHNSYRGAYHALGKAEREIGRSRRGYESVHPETLRRLERTRYRPHNLLEFLDRHA